MDARSQFYIGLALLLVDAVVHAGAWGIKAIVARYLRLLSDMEAVKRKEAERELEAEIKAGRLSPRRQDSDASLGIRIGRSVDEE